MQSGKTWWTWVLHNGDSAQKVAENIGTYPNMTSEEYMKLPAFDDYGEALAYRDKLIEIKDDGIYLVKE